MHRCPRASAECPRPPNYDRLRRGHHKPKDAMQSRELGTASDFCKSIGHKRPTASAMYTFIENDSVRMNRLCTPPHCMHGILCGARRAQPQSWRRSRSAEAQDITDHQTDKKLENGLASSLPLPLLSCRLGPCDLSRHPRTTRVRGAAEGAIAPT